MKPGSSWFSVPRPYSTHAPMLGPHELEAARVQLHGGLRMVRQVGVHAVEQAQVVGVLGQVRETAPRSAGRSCRCGVNFHGDFISLRLPLPPTPAPGDLPSSRSRAGL